MGPARDIQRQYVNYHTLLGSKQQRQIKRDKVV